MVAALCAHARAWPSCWMPSRLDHHDQARMSPPLAISLVWQYRQGLGHRQHCETTELICVVIDITRFMCELGNTNRTISKSWRQRRRTPTMGKSWEDLTSKPSRGYPTSQWPPPETNPPPVPKARLYMKRNCSHWKRQCTALANAAASRWVCLLWACGGSVPRAHPRRESKVCCRWSSSGSSAPLVAAHRTVVNGKG